VRDLPGVRGVSALPVRRTRTVPRRGRRGRDARAAIAAGFAAAHGPLYALAPVEPSLEEAFLSLVAEAARTAA
jgi:hypothetical protein